MKTTRVFSPLDKSQEKSETTVDWQKPMVDLYLFCFFLTYEGGLNTFLLIKFYLSNKNSDLAPRLTFPSCLPETTMFYVNMFCLF